MAYKPMWDWMDKHEGKKVGSSYSNLEKEQKRQGYQHKAIKSKIKYSYHPKTGERSPEMQKLSDWVNKEYKLRGGK